MALRSTHFLSTAKAIKFTVCSWLPFANMTSMLDSEVTSKMNAVSACLRSGALVVTVVVLGGASALAQQGKEYLPLNAGYVKETGPAEATGAASSQFTSSANNRLKDALQQAQAALQASPPRYAQAERAYRVAIAADRRNVSAHFGLGYVYARQQRYAEALEPYKRAIDLDPWMPEAHFNLALVYLRLNNKEEALKQLTILKKLKSDLASKIERQINK